MTEESISIHKKAPRSDLAIVLRYPAFVALWLSEALSLVGDRLVMVALVALVYDRTASASAVGLLMVFKAVPALLLGSLAGVFVDRWNRKWIMVIANLLQGLLVFCLPLSADITVIYVIYLFLSMINQFFVPARSAAIPDLVPENTLLTANSLFALSIIFGMALGPAIGAWVIESISLNAAFYLDAATFLIPAVVVACLAIPQKRGADARLNFGNDLREGLVFSRTHPVVLAVLTTITAAFFVIGTVSVTGVVIIRTVLHLESSKFGLVMSALGVGMLCGAILSNLLKGRIKSILMGAFGTILMGIGVLLLPWSGSLVMAGSFAVLIGMGMIIVQINGQMFLQTIAPDMRGRLLGIAQTLTGSATFLAAAVVGLLMEQISVVIVMGIIGVITLIAGVFIALYFQYK